MSWRSRADRFWAGELGVDVRILRAGGLQVCERADPEPGAGVIVVGTSSATVVSVPGARGAAFKAAGLDLGRMPPAPRDYLAWLPGRAPSLDVRGPAFLGYWPASTPPASSGRIREPGPGDRDALAALRELAPAEWDEAGFVAGPRAFGTRAGDDLVAVAGYETWPPELAQLQVFCRPGHRRRGLAAGVLGAAIAHALGAGLLPQYRARDGNTASRALAARLGLAEYGWMASVYLRAA